MENNSSPKTETTDAARVDAEAAALMQIYNESASRRALEAAARRQQEAQAASRRALRNYYRVIDLLASTGARAR
jgi:hypothetical protein